jgi:DNA-binding CsgD family transcriptional regulator
MSGTGVTEVRPSVSADDLQKLVRRSPVPVMLLDLESKRVVEASASFATFFGRDRQSLLNLTADQLTDQPDATRKSLALVSAGVIDGYTRHASFRLPDGQPVECDVRITACTEDQRRHAVVSVLPPNWEDGAARLVPAPEETLTMGTVNGQWVVDRITTGDNPDLAFESGQMLNRSVFVVLHPEDVGELMFVAAQASRQGSAAFGRIRLRSSEGWAARRVGLLPLDAAPSGGYAFILFSGALQAGTTDVDPLDVEGIVETTVENIRASAIAGWMVTFPTALQLPQLSDLTPREYEILLRLAAGERVRLIAKGLHLGESTVRNHLTSIFRKTGVASQGELLTLLRVRAGSRGVSESRPAATEL